MEYVFAILKEKLNSLEQGERLSSSGRRQVEIAREYVRMTEVEFRSLLRSVDRS